MVLTDWSMAWIEGKENLIVHYKKENKVCDEMDEDKDFIVIHKSLIEEVKELC